MDQQPTTSNGFSAFALDFVKQLRAKGHVISDKRKLLELAGPHWERLNDNERELFEMKSQDKSLHNILSKKNRNNKIEIMEEVRVKFEERESDKKRLAEIKDMISLATDRKELDNTIFHFIAVSSFHESSQDILPSELALATFSLRRGLIDDFQIRINPGKFPLESEFDSQEKAEKSHKHPSPQDCEGETDYSNVLDLIIKFIHPLKTLPIFFSNGDTLGDPAQRAQIIEAQKVMKKIFYENQEDDMIDLIKVYPISELFYVLQRTITKNDRHGRIAKQPFPSLIAASNQFLTIGNDLAIQGCDFHDNIDATQHCCLYKVRCFAFRITKWWCS